MDSFQHTPWSIITSFTYRLALDSASRARIIHTWKHEVSRRSKYEKRPLWIPDTSMMSPWHPITHTYIRNGHPRHVLDNAGIWEVLIVVSFGRWPLHLSLPQESAIGFESTPKRISPYKRYAILRTNLAETKPQFRTKPKASISFSGWLLLIIQKVE